MPFYQCDSSGLVKRYDAVQLVSARIVNQSLTVHGLPPLIFVTADDRLIAAAHGETVTRCLP